MIAFHRFQKYFFPREPEFSAPRQVRSMVKSFQEARLPQSVSVKIYSSMALA